MNEDKKRVAKPLLGLDLGAVLDSRATPWPVVIVCGGRSYADRGVVDRTLDTIGPSKVKHGGAPGADELADQWARATGTPVCAFPADWARYGRAAGPIRNRQMLVSGADAVIAFPGGKGTADLVSRARAAGIPVHVVSGGNV